MTQEWEEIFADYKIAHEALVCPKHKNMWQRNEDKGLFYLWKAYYRALNSKTKEPLIYARILALIKLD